MHDVLRFWLDRGVDGFRVDVIWLLIKDAALRDNPPNPNYRPTEAGIHRLLQVHNADQPDIHDVIAGMRSVLERYDERVLIGEIYLPLERLFSYYGKDLGGAHLPFNFQLIHAAWTASSIAKLVTDYEAGLPPGGWPNWVLGNHDQPRIAARVGAAQARIAAMLLLTLRGTPTLYYGDELGIGRVAVPRDAVQDPWEKNEPGLGPRSVAHAIPVGRDTECRLYAREALAAGRFRLHRLQCRELAQRQRINPCPLSSSAVGAAAARRAGHRRIPRDRCAGQCAYL